MNGFLVRSSILLAIIYKHNQHLFTTHAEHSSLLKRTRTGTLSIRLPRTNTVITYFNNYCPKRKYLYPHNLKRNKKIKKTHKDEEKERKMFNKPSVQLEWLFKKFWKQTDEVGVFSSCSGKVGRKIGLSSKGKSFATSLVLSGVGAWNDTLDCATVTLGGAVELVMNWKVRSDGYLHMICMLG